MPSEEARELLNVRRWARAPRVCKMQLRLVKDLGATLDNAIRPQRGPVYRVALTVEGTLAHGGIQKCLGRYD